VVTPEGGDVDDPIRWHAYPIVSFVHGGAIGGWCVWVVVKEFADGRRTTEYHHD
jgi:hypothetical protein